MPRPSLTVTRYAAPTDYARRTRPLMLRAEAAHCLPLGLLPDIESGEISGALLAALTPRGAASEPELVIMQTPPYRLILGEPAGNAASAPPQEVASLLVDALPAGLPGVSGPQPLVGAFAERYAARYALDARRVMQERIYRAERIRPPKGVKGAMRRAAPGDAPQLTEWWRAFSSEITPFEPDRAAASVARDLAAQVGGLFVWEAGGEIVAMAGARGPTPSGMRIGPVYTPPGERGKGYASALVSELANHLLKEGRRFVFLFVNVKNTPAISVYERIGFSPVAGRTVFDFRSGT